MVADHTNGAVTLYVKGVYQERERKKERERELKTSVVLLGHFT